MPEPERDEPLVKTAVAVRRDQLERLKARAKKEDRSFGYYVRTALDVQYPEESDDTDPQEAA